MAHTGETLLEQLQINDIAIARRKALLDFTDADTLGLLHKAQRAYILTLFEGFYDREYVNNRLRIGMVNKRIGVDPRLYLRRELLIAKRHNRIFSLAYFDIDDFKQVNDTEGHFAGDEILRFAGEAMQSACRDIDFPCRVGGDEFCLALPDCTLADARNICQRMIDLFAQRTKSATLNIGIVQTGPTEFLSADDLQRAADSKMYEAKAQMGFKICV